jgi:biotin-(acetyl-CoA carboxylase) ligase
LALDDKHDSKSMLSEYRKRLMMLGKKIVAYGSGEPFEAIAVGIDEVGRLIVKKDSGETLSLASGEIRVRQSDRL